MSALHRRTILAVGEQEPYPSPATSRSAALRTSNLAAVDNRDGPVRSHSHDSHVEAGSKRSVEVTRQSQIVNYREGVNSHVLIGKEDKKLAVDVKKKFDCRVEDIDECADAFIRNFRQQLQIQRLESIENYEQMLARGL